MNFRWFDRFRVLCVTRSGERGASGMNLRIERALERAGLIDPGRTWYAGRPVMVARNDYNLHLYNGDIGILLPERQDGTGARVGFIAANREVRMIAPSRIPEHETLYATTVHKSQGSEYDRVLLVLPPKDTPLLTGEMIYTGVTRARSRFEVHGDAELFRLAVQRRLRRTSGLRDALWSPGRIAPTASS